MLIYSLLFLIPALLFLSNPRPLNKNHTDYLVFSILFVFLIGFRHDTGGDWYNYYRQFLDVSDSPFSYYILKGTNHSTEILFNLFFWLGNKTTNFYVINTIFAAISFYALYKFARHQPYFWLTITISVPFFIIIMVMGYTRQGLALSILMIALTYLASGKPLHYLALIAVAAGFHNSVIVFSALAIPSFLAMEKYRSIVLIILLPIAILGTGYLESYFSTKTQHYIIEAGNEGSYMSSSGALIRILINASAGIAFFIYAHQWRQIFPNDYQVWKILSFATLLSIPLLFLTSSTSADRMALYLLVVQMAVWPRIIYLSQPENRQILILGSIISYGGILFIWLNYADNVWMWLPYHHHILGTL